MLAVIVTGCRSQVPGYWPDLSIDSSTGTIYVAEANGQLFALRAENGATIWSYPLVEERSGGLLGGCSPSAPSDGPFYAAPVFDDEFLYLGSAGEQQRSLLSKGDNNAGLRVLNKLGTLQWTYKGTTDRSVVPPTLGKGVVYLPSSDHSVYAVDLATRDQRWAFETGNWVWATPILSGDTLYIASMDHILYALEAETGREMWRFDQAPSALAAAPALASDTLYIGALDGHMYALSAKTGQSRWERKLDGGIWSTPLLHDETLYFGTLNGQVLALNAADGADVWSANVGGEVRGTPVLVDGILYTGCEDGQLYAFSADTGLPQASPLGNVAEGASIYTSPVFDGQTLYVVATDGEVLALDLEANQTIWRSNPLSSD